MSALALLAALALQAGRDGWNGDSFTLYQGQHASGRIHFRVPTGPCQAAAERLARALEAEGAFAVELDPEANDPDAVRVLAGAPLDPGLEPLALAVGLELFEGGGFRAFGRDYLAPGDAARAVLEDPARAGRPLYLVLGNDKDLLARYLDQLPRLSRPHLWLHSEGELALECPLGPGGRPRAGLARDYLARRTEYFAGGATLELDHLVARAPVDLDVARWRTYQAALALTRRRVLAWLEAEEAPTLELFLYTHAEDFEAALGTSALAVPNRLRPRVHALLAPGVPDDGGLALARVLARELAGECAAPWVEDGLALAAAARWWGRPLADWQTHLGRANLLPLPEELVDPFVGRRWSEHVYLPARALLYQRAAENVGKEPGAVRALWKGAELGDKRANLLYLKAAQDLLRRPGGEEAEGPGQVARARRAEREGRMAAAPYRRGVALVASDAVPYSARTVGETLDEARALGPALDALSLTVFAAGEDPLGPAATLAPRALHGSASDVALASAAAAARARELRVLLALEVLGRPGSWADNVSWTEPSALDDFFKRYRRAATHYALLAELLGADVFSFGANLREVSRTDPQGTVRDPELFERRRAGWKDLIERLRRTYSGGLTYTARFPAEGHESSFLELLDFVGVALYPRFAPPGGEPDDDDLRRALRFELQQAIDLAVRWNKPLLLVQLGFPARAESWAMPAVPRGALDLGAQRRFAAALAEVLGGRLENSATLRGFYLWNWPLDRRYAGPGDGGFSLRGKPAEAALGQLFAR
jgi:hypothetical protein